jgi:hypothetical protein
MFIPGETLFLGRPHTYGHKCELVSGKVLHITEDAKRIIEAPFSLHTTPGYQMVLYTMSDVVGRTYHPNPTEERDTQKLEDDIFGSVEDLKKLGALVAGRISLEPRELVSWQA